MNYMLTPFIDSFRIIFAIILAAVIERGMRYYQDYSSISTTNNNKTRG